MTLTQSYKQIFKYIILLISYLIPKDKNKWVIGSSFGFSNNTKYLYYYIKDFHSSDIDIIWIAKPSQVGILDKLGVNYLNAMSLKGIWRTLRSKVYIYDSYINDINGFTFGNAIKINLWHGVGIKNIERKIKSGPLKRIFASKNIFKKLQNLHFFVKPDVFLSTSPMMTDHFCKCFQIHKDRCIEVGYPRNSLFNKTNTEILNYLNVHHSLEQIDLIKKVSQYSKRYLYMPTWRDSQSDFLNDSKFDLIRVNKIMEESSSILLLKLHPATKLNIKINDLTNILILPSNIDIYPIMPFIESLITDYSSIYYDWLLLKDKELILYIPDLDEYISSDRDLAFPFYENTEGLKIYNFNDFIKYLKREIEFCKDEYKLDELKEKFWGSHSNENSNEILYNKIMNKLKINVVKTLKHD